MNEKFQNLLSISVLLSVSFLQSDDVVIEFEKKSLF